MRYSGWSLFLLFLIALSFGGCSITTAAAAAALECDGGGGGGGKEGQDQELDIAETGQCVNAVDDDGTTTTTTSTMEEDPSCPSRALIIRCAGIHLDTNANGKLDRFELEAAIGSLPWFARGVLQILGSVDKMVRIHTKPANKKQQQTKADVSPKPLMMDIEIEPANPFNRFFNK
jgi:hypothetical protein